MNRVAPAAISPSTIAPIVKPVLLETSVRRRGGAASTPPLVGDPLVDGAIFVGSTLGFTVELAVGVGVEPPPPEPPDAGGRGEPGLGFELFVGVGVLDDAPTARAAFTRRIP